MLAVTFRASTGSANWGQPRDRHRCRGSQANGPARHGDTKVTRSAQNYNGTGPRGGRGRQETQNTTRRRSWSSRAVSGTAGVVVAVVASATGSLRPKALPHRVPLRLLHHPGELQRQVAARVRLREHGVEACLEVRRHVVRRRVARAGDDRNAHAGGAQRAAHAVAARALHLDVHEDAGDRLRRLGRGRPRVGREHCRMMRLQVGAHLVAVCERFTRRTEPREEAPGDAPVDALVVDDEEVQPS
mmetsp:Transcript_2726/g.9574  ORF Transcript_2726/g.9574 Transcript_2726/m.9574 type:complete len:244 (-) Transcript_2726:3354-4085(-)